MQLSLTYLRLTLAGLLLFYLQSCSHNQAELPAPITRANLALLTVGEAQHWYTTQAGPIVSAAPSGLSSTTGNVSGPLPIDWVGATDTIAINRTTILAPIRGLGLGFTNSGYQSFRYLLVTRPSSNLISGAVVEILSKSTDKPSKSAQKALLIALYNRHLTSTGDIPNNFTGFIFFYSENYQYQNGEGYVNGKPFAKRMHLSSETPTVIGSNKSPKVHTLGCDSYLISSYDPPYIETVCYSEPDFGSYDPNYNGGSYDPGYGGGNQNAPVTGTSSGPSSGNGTTTIINIGTGNLRPCAGQIVMDVQAMANNSTLAGGPIANLINAISSNKNISITFNEASNLIGPQGNIDRAQTSHTSGTNNYTITLNSDFLNGPGGATDLAIASDIIHEIMHVYMMDWADQNNISQNTPLDVLMDMFFDPNRPNAQHETMVTMVSYMGQALLAYYNDSFISSGRLQNINQNYCEALAWQGLQATDSYKSHAQRDPSWADQITAINQAERHPDTAGATMPTSAGSVTIQVANGSQTCP